MQIQTSRGPHYARGVLRGPDDIDRVCRQHIVNFWSVPIIEGRATITGHSIDHDEEIDPFEAMDSTEQYEPEAQGGRFAAQKGEFLVQEEACESPCARCNNLWCSSVTADECLNEH